MSKQFDTKSVARVDGQLSFGRWYALAQAMGTKYGKKVGVSDKAVKGLVAKYNAGQSPKQAIGVV